jgi:DNA adenine methylase
MAYLGGKAKGAEHILECLNSPVFNSFDYIEPFCGYCHIVRRVKNKKKYTISDNNRFLIVLLKYIQKNKNKHPTINQEEYKRLRENPDKNPLRAAYAAFCYSYNGKFFGGFVEKYGDRNYPEERKKYYDELHDNETFHKSKIQYVDYTKYMDVKNKLIYCDPPYSGTTEYHSTFNSDKFWDDMRTISKNNYVFISEYTAPDDFICITQKTKRMSVAGRGATRKRVEKLFIHKSKLTDPKIKELRKNTEYNCTLVPRKTRKATRH